MEKVGRLASALYEEQWSRHDVETFKALAHPAPVPRGDLVRPHNFSGTISNPVFGHEVLTEG